LSFLKASKANFSVIFIESPIKMSKEVKEGWNSGTMEYWAEDS
jgi:hypothetical protein